MAAESSMLPLGTPAPEFSLADAEGVRHALADAADAPATLVVFLCNHCPYVQHVAATLGRLAVSWQERGVAVFGINSNDPEAYPDDRPELMAGFAAAHGWTFPYLFDESQAVAAAYKAACTPDFFLFDAGKRLLYRGRLDASRPNSGVPVTGGDLAAAVDAVLTGQPVSADQAPSIGCSIKWRRGNEPT